MATEVTNGLSPSSTTQDNTKTVYTLHVSNVPDDLEKDGLRTIFLDYGNVTGVLPVKGKNQAYISYASYSAAERAIAALHNEPPLCMKLQFQDKKMRSYHKPPVVDLSGPIQDHRYKNYDLDCYRNMPTAMGKGLPNCTPSIRPGTYSVDDDMLYPYPTDSYTFNPYEAPGPYYDTNLMYTRGVTHISKDGRRRVAYGRGCTVYDLPEPRYEIEDALQRVYEKREHGLYEYASHDLDDDSKTCLVCSSPTAFRCQRCAIAFYCSKACQKKDWQNHKVDCQPLPPLVKPRPKPSENDDCNGSFVHPSQQRQSEIQMEDIRQALPKVQQSQAQSKESPRSSISESKEKSASTQQNNIRKEPVAKSPVGSIKGLDVNQRIPNGDPRNGSSRSGSFTSNHSHHNKQFQQETSSKHSPPRQQNQPERPQQRSPQKQNQQKSRAESIKTSDEDIVFDEGNKFLPRDRFVDVHILNHLGHGEYWVQRTDKITALEDFQAHLAKVARQAKFVLPKDDTKCVLEFQDNFYRCHVLSVNGDVCEVFFLDYGIIDTLEVKKVFNQTFDEYPYFARRIRLVDGADDSLKNLEESKLLSVRQVSVMGNGTIIVQAKPSVQAEEKTIVEPEQLEKPIEKSSPVKQVEKPAPVQQVEKPAQVQQVEKPAPTKPEDPFLSKLRSLPSVLDNIELNCDGAIMLHGKIGANEYNVSVIPNKHMKEFEMLLEDLKVACLSLIKKHPNYQPKVGEFVCGENDTEDWYRGIVSSIKPAVRLAVVDESRFFVPRRCSPMPTGFNKIVAMGLMCQLKPDTVLPEEMEGGGEFTVVQIAPDMAMISLKSPEIEFETKAKLRKWIPKPEQQSISYPTLVSGNKVVMLQLHDPATVYVKIAEPEEKERVHMLEQNVAACARNRKPLANKPVVGEMVMSIYSADQNYYRAVVTKIEDNKFLVRYIDYGNEEERTMKDLFELPDSLKTQAAGCIKIVLKGIDKNQPLSTVATDLYLGLIQEESLLTCTFEGDPTKDGVILITEQRDVVNDVMKDVLKPNWKVKDPTTDRKVYTLNDLPPYKLGDVGDEITVVPLAAYPKGTAIVCPDDEVFATAVQVDMFAEIQKYASATTTHYVPRNNELCIAKFLGEYYRGLCIDTNVTPNEALILFIDYGNTDAINHEDIRLITPDFLGLGALGVLCNIESAMFPNGLSEPAKKRLLELITINEPMVVKILDLDDANSPNLEVPSIRVKLTQEKLI